jgi:hypothetical protein
MINGGSHAGNKLAMQEFMVLPVGAKNFKEAMQIGSEIYHHLKKVRTLVLLNLLSIRLFTSVMVLTRLLWEMRVDLLQTSLTTMKDLSCFLKHLRLVGMRIR